jgi:hypothetical protein
MRRVFVSDVMSVIMRASSCARRRASGVCCKAVDQRLFVAVLERIDDAVVLDYR